MLIHSCGAALPQNLHDVLVALGLGSDYDELALVIERRGVGLDHIVRQMTIGKMGLKCTGNSGRIRFDTARSADGQVLEFDESGVRDSTNGEATHDAALKDARKNMEKLVRSLGKGEYCMP